MLNPSKIVNGPEYLLVDNGSLRPEATFSLRRLASELATATGERVHPVSLLHANRVDAADLAGVPAATFLPFIKRMIAQGKLHFRVVPLFFGPSLAIADYLPGKIAELEQKHPGLRVEIEPCLCPGDAESDAAVVAMLSDAVKQLIKEQQLTKPRVALVDHGSPIEPVTAVRNRLANQLAAQLGSSVAAVSPCSMERRDGEEYDFNEPLLEKLLREPDWCEGPVVVAMLFLQPGRHAGDAGDVATICADAEAACPKLSTHRTALVGEHPALIDLLAKRLRGLQALD